MAGTIKKSDNATEKKVEVKLPRAHGHNAEQHEFFSINDRRYLVKRGEYVPVPEEVQEVIHNRERAEEDVIRYLDKLEENEASKKEEFKTN